LIGTRIYVGDYPEILDFFTGYFAIVKYYLREYSRFRSHGNSEPPAEELEIY